MGKRAGATARPHGHGWAFFPTATRRPVLHVRLAAESQDVLDNVRISTGQRLFAFDTSGTANFLSVSHNEQNADSHNAQGFRSGKRETRFERCTMAAAHTPFEDGRFKCRLPERFGEGGLRLQSRQIRRR